MCGAGSQRYLGGVSSSVDGSNPIISKGPANPEPLDGRSSSDGMHSCTPGPWPQYIVYTYIDMVTCARYRSCRVITYVWREVWG